MPLLLQLALQRAFRRFGDVGQRQLRRGDGAGERGGGTVSPVSVRQPSPIP
jgi:hypothetical protein